MNLKDVLDSKEVLRKLQGKEMPAVMAYRLHKLIKAIEPELVQFEESRNALIRKYGLQHDDGMIEVTPGTLGYQQFVEEITSLLELELDITFKKFDVDNIPFQLTPNEVAAISWLLEDEDGD